LISYRTQQVPSIDAEDISMHESIVPGTLLVVEDLCHLVRHNVGAAKLCLKIHGNQLVKIPRPVPLEDSEYPVEPVPSKSLQEVLREEHLTSRDRIVIAYILARSVWQYYNTDWLNALWTTDNIHFMIEKREDGLPEALTLNPVSPLFCIFRWWPSRIFYLRIRRLLCIPQISAYTSFGGGFGGAVSPRSSSSHV
jgi:hypothetical protein